MISHSDMRQADINRVKKAREHLKAAATTILSNIKWENMKVLEDDLVGKAKIMIAHADNYLNDTLNIQQYQ